MIGVISKDMRHYLLNLIIIGVGMTTYFSIVHGSMDSTAVYLMTGYLYLVILAAILAAEMNETRYRGYEVLAALPVRGRSVVAGKFALILLTAAAYTAIIWFHFSHIGSDPARLVMARRWLLLNAAASVVVGGGSYVGVYRFGFDRWIWPHTILLVVCFMTPIVLNESIERGMLAGATPLAGFVSSVEPAAVCAVALAVFAGLWYAAALVKEGRDV